MTIHCHAQTAFPKLDDIGISRTVNYSREIFASPLLDCPFSMYVSHVRGNILGREFETYFLMANIIIVLRGK